MIYLLMFLINLGLGAKEGKITLKIMDAYTGKKVISEIKVMKNKEIFIKTKAKGIKNLSLPEGEYIFYFQAEGYFPLEVRFYITPNKKLDVKVHLTPIKRKEIFPPKKEGITGIRGYVTDNEGNPLKGVNVTLKGKKLRTSTNNEGVFEFWINIPEREYKSPEDVPKDTLILIINGYKTLKREIILIPENMIIKLKMEKGEGEKFIPEIRGKGTGDEYIPPPPKKEIEENILRVPLDPPATIKVGISCNCTDCSSVEVMALEYYVESGLDDEWIASWAQHSLRSGAIPYRSYGTWYVHNPLDPNYDICSSTCCQVWDGSDIYASCTLAAYITNGILLERNNTYARSEYSAENNNCGCGDGYAGTSTTWPCIYDPLCAGYSCYGHGRGMCQWGTSRWANNGKYWKWIVEHYYEPGNVYIATPMIITSSSPSPSHVTPGETFTIYYDVNSYCEKKHNNILLGASIYSSETGFISDPQNDLLVTITPGTQTVSRIFTLPSNTPSDTYDLYTALWVDVDEEGNVTGNDLDLYLFIQENALVVQTVEISEKLPPNFKLVSKNSSEFRWIKIFPNLAYYKIDLIFSIQENSQITLDLIDLTGKKVRNIFRRYMEKGTYSYSLNTQFLKSGIYFLTLKNREGKIIKTKINILR